MSALATFLHLCLSIAIMSQVKPCTKSRAIVCISIVLLSLVCYSDGLYA